MEILDVKTFIERELYVCSIEVDTIILRYDGLILTHKCQEKMSFTVIHHLKYDEYVPEIGDTCESSASKLQEGILTGEVNFRHLTPAERVLYG